MNTKYKVFSITIALVLAFSALLYSPQKAYAMIYHVTGHVYTSETVFQVCLLGRQDVDGKWVSYCRNNQKDFGFYDLKLGTYNVYTLRNGVTRSCYTTSGNQAWFKAGYSVKTGDVRVYVRCET